MRSELAELERLGLLTHPHTSAGRVPTERGYRYYADRLLERLDPQPGGFPLDLTAARNEVDSALQATTEMLSQLTRLLALVSAPPLETATVRHVEVLLLQPQVVMVVVITSTGGVTKRVFRFDEPVDPGLVELGGAVPERPRRRPRARQQPAAPPPRRSRRSARASGVPRRAAAAVRRGARRRGAEPLRRRHRRPARGSSAADELESYQRLLEVLEKRAALLDVLSQALDPRRPFVRVGAELEHPALRELALVGAVVRARRTARSARSACSARCAWTTTRRSARSARAAAELSRFVEDVYEDN